MRALVGSFFLRPILIAEIELNELLYLLVRVEGEIESFTMRFELDDSFRKKSEPQKKDSKLKQNEKLYSSPNDEISFSYPIER